MGEKAADYTEAAARCRRLADGISDAKARDALRQMAAEYEARACEPDGPTPQPFL